MEDILKISNKQDENTDISTDPTEHIPAVNNIKQQNVNQEDLDNRWLRWKCLKCSYLYEGSKELRKCPRCGNEDPDYFSDAD